MEKIAINVALIPPDWVMDKAIEINKKLVSEFSSSLVLGKEECLPHITLLQSVIDMADISKVENIIKQIAGNSSHISLKITGVKVYCEPQPTSSFDIESNSELKKLHKLVVEALSIFRYSEVKKEFFYDEPSNRMVNYVKDFEKEYAFEKYWPHITLGTGRGEQIEPFEFKVNRLVLARLGSHGTCAKVLHSIELKQTQL